MFLRKNKPNNIIHKLKHEAKKILPKQIYDYITGGAGDESTLNRNKLAYLNIALTPKVLKGLDSIDTKIDILGSACKSPILIAPMSFHGLVNSEKEIATVEAAKEVGCIMAVSMMSNVALEEISKATDFPLWFQLHLHANHEITKQLIKRAENAGYKAIILTVDIPVVGIRWRDVNNEFKIPSDCISANFIENTDSCSDDVCKINLAGTQFNPLATWDDVKWIKSVTKLPILLKGIMHREDAVKALECGVDGIIVSNHGGRQLDGVAAPIEVLPQIKTATQGKIPILIDGGIRSGTDVLKAIALGADAILVGRPVLWGLAARGKLGVVQVLSCLSNELCLGMKLVACSSIKDIKDKGESLILAASKLDNIKLTESDRSEIEKLRQEIRKLSEKQNDFLSQLNTTQNSDLQQSRAKFQ